jgi:hypothetical protein
MDECILIYPCGQGNRRDVHAWGVARFFARSEHTSMAGKYPANVSHSLPWGFAKKTCRTPEVKIPSPVVSLTVSRRFFLSPGAAILSTEPAAQPSLKHS